jgi:TatD DNase family protein
MIETHLPSERGKIVLHWFTGSLSEARRAAALGCYFSINTEMARTERGRALLAALPSDRLLTETDGPFTQVSGRPAEPANAIAAVEALATVRAVDADIIARTVLANLRSLLL